MQIQKMGWRRDSLDKRDKHYHVTQALQTIPDHVDLRPQMPPVYDQLMLGSCTSNAIAAAMQYDAMRQKLPESPTPSRLAIYYNERVIEHTVHSDAGAELRNGAKSVNQSGACDETLWPYDITKFDVKPNKACYREGKTDKVLTYARVQQDSHTLQAALASTDVVVFGFTVYESFEYPDVANTGVVSMPGANEQVLGGHAVVLVGFDRNNQVYLCRNSWGKWGMGGYFTMPFAYVHDPSLASDFWILSLVS